VNQTKSSAAPKIMIERTIDGPRSTVIAPSRAYQLVVRKEIKSHFTHFDSVSNFDQACELYGADRNITQVVNKGCLDTSRSTFVMLRKTIDCNVSLVSVMPR
jgi:hypothetical protein